MGNSDSSNSDRMDRMDWNMNSTLATFPSENKRHSDSESTNTTDSRPHRSFSQFVSDSVETYMASKDYVDAHMDLPPTWSMEEHGFPQIIPDPVTPEGLRAAYDRVDKAQAHLQEVMARHARGEHADPAKVARDVVKEVVKTAAGAVVDDRVDKIKDDFKK